MKKIATLVLASITICSLVVFAGGCASKTDQPVKSNPESVTADGEIKSSDPDTNKNDDYGKMTKIWYDGTLFDLSTFEGKSFFEIIEEFQDAGLTAYYLSGTNTNDVSKMPLTIEQIAAASQDMGEAGLLTVEFGVEKDEPFLTLNYFDESKKMDLMVTNEDEKLAFTEDKLSCSDLKAMDNEKMISKELFDIKSEDGKRLESEDTLKNGSVIYLLDTFHISYNLPVRELGSLEGGVQALPAINTAEAAKELIYNLAVLSNGETVFDFAQWIDEDTIDGGLNLFDQAENLTEKYWNIQWSVGDQGGNISEPATGSEIREQYALFCKASEEQAGRGTFSYGYYLNRPSQDAVVLTISTKDNVVDEKSVLVMFGSDSTNTVTKQNFLLAGKDMDFIKENFLKGLNQEEEDTYYLTDKTYRITVDLDDQEVESMVIRKAY